MKNGAEGIQNKPYLADSSPNDLCRLVAERMRAERLRQNLTQSSVAARARLALRTYRRLEATGQGSVQALMAVLKALGRQVAAVVLFPNIDLQTGALHPVKQGKHAFAPRAKRIAQKSVI